MSQSCPWRMVEEPSDVGTVCMNFKELLLLLLGLLKEAAEVRGATQEIRRYKILVVECSLGKPEATFIQVVEGAEEVQGMKLIQENRLAKNLLMLKRGWKL